MGFEVKGMDQLLQMLDDLESDLNSLGMLAEEPSFVQMATDLVGQNMDEVWASKGSAINESWNGNTLVKTGNLRNSWRNPNSLRVSVQGNIITFGSNVSYSPYVNNTYTFIGVTNRTQNEAAGLVDKWLQQNGKLNWN